MSAHTSSNKPYEENNFINTHRPVWNYSLFTQKDIIDFQQGNHYTLYTLFGNKQIKVLHQEGTYFAVWAPHATHVMVIGNFNNWNTSSHALFARYDHSGIWEGFIPHVLAGESYKYHIVAPNEQRYDKADPYTHFTEKKPLTASIIWGTFFDWTDDNWMKKRKKNNSLDAPWSIYEVHLASWKRPDTSNEDTYFTYQQIAKQLIPYVKEMGFTHVELMPIMEHPFDGSWGYQGTNFYAPTSRFGSPQDFAYFVNTFHQADIGVILDWVPSHFPYDAHGLHFFDGTHTYEYADRRKGFHPEWNSYIFNYARGEVKSFLISNAHFWFNRFHIDGMRVDAVSSMLRLDYCRKEGEWEPNIHGGNGNLEAIAFLKDLNITIYRDFPDVQTIAEEASDWPGISKPTYEDGLGFGMKWMMGWMHDTIRYFKRLPIDRKHFQNEFTFSMAYYYDEKFMLPLSHDEVVHGKSPMIYKMAGDEWQKFANLRLLYTYMFTHPGAKLLFMGNEFGSTIEWNYKSELPWHLLNFVNHGGLKYCVQQLNHILKNNPALYEYQYEHRGFEWVDLNHRDESVVAYMRKGTDPHKHILVILNLTAEVRHHWKIKVQGKQIWKEIFNSDSKDYWGTGDVFNPAPLIGETMSKINQQYLITCHLPPLAGIILM